MDSIPIAQLRWMENPHAAYEQALGTMIALRDVGKIRHVGLSKISEQQLDIALAQTPVATVSNAYSVLDRADDALVQRCAQEGIAYLPFFPLGASPVRSGAGVTGAAAVSQVAARLGATPTQVALAWLLQRTPTTCRFRAPVRLLTLTRIWRPPIWSCWRRIWWRWADLLRFSLRSDDKTRQSVVSALLSARDGCLGAWPAA